MQDDWFSVLINGGVQAYSANRQAKSAGAVAAAQANYAQQAQNAALAQMQLAQSGRLEQLADAREQNSRYVIWGMGLFVLLFITRATNRG